MPEPSERMCCESTTDDYHAHGCADDGPTGPGPGFDVLPPAPDLQALKAEIDAAVRAEPSVLPVDLAKPQDRPRSLREILFSHRALAAATALEITELMAELQPLIEAGTEHLVPLVLVPVEVFDADECEHPGCDDERCPGVGHGLMDAVGPGWSDCNRAEGRIYRVDEPDEELEIDDLLFEGEQVRVQIWVSPGDVAWFQKRHGELSPKRPLLTDPDSAALESEMMATVEQAFALKNKAGVGPTKRLISNIYREGLTVCAELNEVAHGLRELRSSSTMPETNFDELPNAKDWARRIEIWDEQNPVLAAFLDKLAQTDV